MANGNTNYGNDQGTGTVGADGFLGPLDGVVGGNTPAAGAFTSLSATTITNSGLASKTPQIVAAAGASQGTATAISKSLVFVTVTASTEGVKLPTAATGVQVQVICPGTVGVKVYPFTGDKIDAGSTNIAQALVAGKANIYSAKDATSWYTLKGA